jgi:hypothetical protein
LLLATSVGCFYLVYICFGTFAAFEGEEFSTRSIFQPKVTAHARDFIGYDSDETWRCWRLVCRTDLRTVTIPWFSNNGSNGHDVEVRSWLSQHVARAETYLLKQVAEGTFGQSRSLVVLANWPLVGDMDMGDERELELARAAYAVCVNGYRGCQNDLLRVLVALPSNTVAKQYVVQALYSVGSESCVTALLPLWSTPGGPDFAEQLAAVVCRWCTRQHTQFIRKLTQDDSAFVRGRAEAALNRLA